MKKKGPNFFEKAPKRIGKVTYTTFLFLLFMGVLTYMAT